MVKKIIPKQGYKFVESNNISEDYIYDNEDELRDDLENCIEQIDYYECPKCEERFEEIEGALECCEDE